MKTLLFLLLPLFALAQSQTNAVDIFDAVRMGDLDNVKKVIEVSADQANIINNQNHSLLIMAAYYKQGAIVDYLLPRTKTIDHKSENGTALAAAVVKNQIPIIKALLNYNADVNITDANGVSPLMYAIMFRNIPAIELLISHGADRALIDTSEKSTFEYALQTDNQEIINLIKN